MRSLLVVFLFLPIFLQAQVTMESFIGAALDAPGVRILDNQNAFLESDPYRLSLIRGMEFRTETNQLDPDRQDFALRLNPANPWELKRNNQYFETYQEVVNLDRNIELKKVLKLHYLAIIDWVYLEEQKKIKEEEQAITLTMIQILEAQRLSDYFDANDYAELKIEQAEKVMELEQIYFEEDAQRGIIESFYPLAKSQEIYWSVDQLVSIDSIASWVSRHESYSELGEVAYRQKKVELANSEWALEKSNINIGYLQAQYQQYQAEQERKPWSIGLGITLPLFNPNKGDMAKRKLEIYEAEGDLAAAVDEQQSGLEQSKRKVKTLLVRYYNLQEQLENLNLDELADNLQNVKDSNPIVVVKLKRSLIKSRNIAISLQKEIYTTYIDYLAYSEALQQQPLKNYLTY